MRHLSQKEVYEIAQQLLLGEKTWDDFAWLEDDDRGRVEVIVKRGAKALAESKEKHAVPTHLVKKASKVQQGYVYVPKRHKSRFLSEAKGLHFQPFPLAEIFKQGPGVRRRFVEQVNRKLGSEEVGIWIRGLKPDEWEQLKQDLSPSMQEDFLFRFQKVGDEIPEYEKEATQVKFSLTAVTFLKDCKELDAGTERVVDGYHKDLEEQLAKYCVSLPEKMGILQHLRQFTNHQWTKLAGFTPRREMAQMVDFLPDDVVARLLHPLPASQKHDVNELAMRLAEDRQKNPRAYADSISSLKRWGATVNKVVCLSMDHDPS